ncbi:MAG: ribonuclease R [Candidatus Aminicenantes bacterium]|nr:ribonuclease R [Candidatus Aminicenantes bacterium]
MDNKVISLLKKKREGLSFQRISLQLRISPRERQVLKKSLRRLESQGVILRLKRRYLIPAKSNLVKGKLIASLRGYGFVTPEGDSTEDIFIPGRYSGGALHGDVVEVLYLERGKKGKPEGRVVRIVKRGKRRRVGLYKERWGKPFFLPFDSPSLEEIPLLSTKNLSPLPGMIVEIDRNSMHLKEVLGMPDDPGVDTRVVIQRYDLASFFSKEALTEAEKCTSKICLEDKKERVDYRNWMTVTIDGESAQDFDDAVSIKMLESGHFLLGIHIADVSHYVKPGSFLDREAFERGTSVYFPELTLPMLPEKLSNHICSLRPKEEKLTVSVLLEIDRDGEVLKTEFHPSLIRTAERMTYHSVYKIFEGDKGERGRYSHLVPALLMMEDLARILRRRRVKQGSLDFDILEPELVYKEGKLHSVVAFERNEAHRVIEEYMVVANEAVSSFLSKKHVPLIRRIHPRPALKDLERLREILFHFGLSLPSGKKVDSRDLQYVLKQFEGKPEEKFINLQVLKSLKLAVYSEEDEGHYGLAKKEYTHFTSPIRRYPDLVVHRILKTVLRQEKVKMTTLSSLALHCSQKERNAGVAEKDLMEWRIFRLLKRKLGEEFEGVIVDITRAGLVVELADYFVSGIISYSDMDGDYYFKKSEKTLTGRRTGRTFELGDWVKVIGVAVDPILKRLSLILSSEREKKVR